MTVRSGGTLLLDGGTLTARSVRIRSGATLSLQGEMSLLSVGSLTLESGAVLLWNGGVIEIAGGTYSQADVDLIVGDSAIVSTLRLLDGASALITQDTFIGMDAGDVGVIEIMGATFKTGRTLFVGFVGEGWLDVTEGGLASAEDAYIGFLPGSFGEVLVSGASSRLEVLRLLEVGQAGAGVVRLVEGGELLIGEALSLGDESELSIELIGVETEAPLWVEGEAMLGGVLRVTLSPDGVFDLSVGDRIDVIAASMMTDRFEEVVLPELAGGLAFEVIYRSGRVSLIVVRSADSGELTP